MTTATPTLYRQITTGQNGTRIYHLAGEYYLVDGEVDCGKPGADKEVQRRSYASNRNVAKIERIAERNTGV